MNDLLKQIEGAVAAANRLGDIDEVLAGADEQGVNSILADLKVFETAVEVLVLGAEQKLARYVSENYGARVWVQKFPALHQRVMNRVKKKEG